MAVIVIAYQAFPLPDKSIALKEVGIVDVVSNYECQYLAGPPCKIDVFSARHRQTLRYLVDKVHGIPWNAGIVPLEDVEEVVKKAVREADLVYIKGLERLTYLMNLTGESIDKFVDLDEVPYISATVERRPHFRCQYDHPHHSRLRCALEQAIRYRDFLRANHYFRL